MVVAFLPGEPNEPYVVGLLWQEDGPDGGRIGVLGEHARTAADL